MDTKKLFTVEEFQKIIPMSKSGIYQGIRKNTIAVVQIGKRKFIPGWFVEKLLKAPE